MPSTIEPPTHHARNSEMPLRAPDRPTRTVWYLQCASLVERPTVPSWRIREHPHRGPLRRTASNSRSGSGRRARLRPAHTPSRNSTRCCWYSGSGRHDKRVTLLHGWVPPSGAFRPRVNGGPRIWGWRVFLSPRCRPIRAICATGPEPRSRPERFTDLRYSLIPRALVDPAQTRLGFLPRSFPVKLLTLRSRSYRNRRLWRRTPVRRSPGSLWRRLPLAAVVTPRVPRARQTDNPPALRALQGCGRHRVLALGALLQARLVQPRRSRPKRATSRLQGESGSL